MKKKTSTTYKLAKQLIPGGTQLFSKKPDLFAPGEWPGYYSKAKGVNIWDLDGNKYLDMSIMNVGACILGYADKFVDKEVKKVINKGVSSSINAVEEFELAKLLLKLHPWAGGARFARGGGEAMSIAIRIARAHTKKDKILFSGYHGWNDWYLSSNIQSKKNLNKFLLSGLDPAGVPKELINSAIPFDDSDIKNLERKIKKYKDKVAAIVIEPARGNEVNKSYLKKLVKIADKNKSVLIFDEITSGFRMNNGGIHLKSKIYPDIAVFAKSIANGYAMSAIIGKRKIMGSASKTFISSTNWTERIGPTAAISTITKCINHKVFNHNIDLGKKMKKLWKKIAHKHGLKIQISGIDTLPSFSFLHKDNQKMQTFFTREMLRYNILAYRQFRPSFAHNNKHLKTYEKFADKIFKNLSENKYKKLNRLEVSMKSFSRLTKE